MPNDSSTGGYLLQEDALPAQDEALEDQLQAAVVGITGLPETLVRPRWQPNPPAHPDAGTDWAAIGVTHAVSDYLGAIVHRSEADGGEGADELQRHETLTVLASFYGPKALGYATRLRDGLMIAQNREVLRFQHDIALIEAGDIIAAPDLVNQQWIRRQDLTLTFRRQITRTYPVRNILSAVGEIDTDQPSTQAFIVEP